MRPEGPFDLQAVDDLGSGPAFRGAQHDHRPARAGGVAVGARLVLDGVDVVDDGVEGGGHQFVHVFGVVAFDVVRFPAAAAQELVEFLGFDAGQHGGVADLVAVQMQDRQHRPVADRVEELGGMPGGGQRPGLGLAVADDAGHDQVRIVERGAERVAQRVAQFPAFVDRSRSRRRHMAGNTAGKRELGEQLLHPGLVLTHVGIDLAVGALEVGVGDQGRTAVAGAGDVEHVQVVLRDDPVEVHVDEVLPRRGAPMPDHQRFHIRERQWPLQQRIVVQIDLADRQVVRRPPVRVHPM